MASLRTHRPAPLPSPADLQVIEAARVVARTTVEDLHDPLLAGWGSARHHDKRDGSPVTAVDVHTDEVLSSAITANFPSHAVVSEEGITTWDGSEWTWIVDPIDGTTNYAAGLPYWATSIALAHHGEVVWGMVDMPALQARVEATRGAGTTANGHRVTVGPTVDLDDPATRHVPMAVSSGTIRRVVTGTHFKPRVLGAYAVDLALVASGSLGGAFARVPSVWDVAAGILCVTEAGGSVVEVDHPGNLPLREGTDLDTHQVRTAAGSDPGWLADAVARMWPGE